MSETPSITAPSRGRAIFYVLVIFIAGSVFGSALTIGIGRQMIQRANDTATWNVEAIRRLDRHLELTPEQRARLRPIVGDMARRLRESRITARQEWTAIMQETRTKMRAELTPEQQVEFDELAAKARDNLGRFLGASPEPGRRPTPPDQPPARPHDGE